MTATQSKETSMEDFEALLNESFSTEARFEGSVVKGLVVDIQSDFVIIDVGLKSEGRVPKREFMFGQQDKEIKVGDEVEVYVERLEDKNGEVALSREKARREEVWMDLEKMHAAGERVSGLIVSLVKGGYIVDIGVPAFLPRSQADIRPIKDVSPLMNNAQPYQILKMDRARGNIVVSRRVILEESQAEARSELMSDIGEGQTMTGTVKNITDYGAFVDLGGIDGLLHVTDISWQRINHPSEVLTIGQEIEVKVIRFDKESQRISLGMKQLQDDPWVDVAARYTAGTTVKGTVNNITDYGAFVELETGIEGLVHVTEMSWTKKNVHANKQATIGQEVDVKVLEVDTEKRRISLSIRQTVDNPWQQFADSHKEGDTLDGTISNIAEFGLFVSVPGGIDGMVHASDLSWEEEPEEALKAYNKGDSLTVKVLEVDAEKERIALGVKQLTKDPGTGKKTSKSSSAVASNLGVAKGEIVTCTITAIDDKGVTVEFKDGLTGYIKRGDLSRERSEQRPDRFATGEKVDAKVIAADKKKGISLSIKAREIDEDKEALEQYGSASSGAALGGILGAALQQATETAKTEADDDKTAKKAAKKSPAKKTAKKAKDAETSESDADSGDSAAE